MHLHKYIRTLGLIGGAILLIIPTVLTFGEAGRTASSNIVLIYCMIIAFQLLIFGLFGLTSFLSQSKIGSIAPLIAIIGASFLMANHALSIIEYIGEVEEGIIYDSIELMGLGFFATLFPLGLFFIGIALTKLKFSKLGVALSGSTVVMFTGLFLTPWLHHIGIISVAACLISLALVVRAPK